MVFEDTDPAHAEFIGRSIVGACRGHGWASPTQPMMLGALFRILFSMDLDFSVLEPLSCDGHPARRVHLSRDHPPDAPHRADGTSGGASSPALQI